MASRPSATSSMSRPSSTRSSAPTGKFQTVQASERLREVIGNVCRPGSRFRLFKVSARMTASITPDEADNVDDQEPMVTTPSERRFVLVSQLYTVKRTWQDDYVELLKAQGPSLEAGFFFLKVDDAFIGETPKWLMIVYDPLQTSQSSAIYSSRENQRGLMELFGDALYDRKRCYTAKSYSDAQLPKLLEWMAQVEEEMLLSDEAIAQEAWNQVTRGILPEDLRNITVDCRLFTEGEEVDEKERIELQLEAENEKNVEVDETAQVEVGETKQAEVEALQTNVKSEDTQNDKKETAIAGEMVVENQPLVEEPESINVFLDASIFANMAAFL